VFLKEDVLKQVQEIPVPTAQTVSSSSSSSQAKDSKKDSTKPAVSASGTKIPKWFKPSGRK
jgi:hypothetical protein